jgi:hypothetical protein
MVRMSLAIPFLVLLLCGFFVYRALAPSRPRAGRPGTTGVAAWSDGSVATADWAGESSHGTPCASDSSGSDGGSCSSDSGGGSDGGGGGSSD